MHCEDIRHSLERGQGQVDSLTEAGRAHLQDCAACAGYAEDLEFKQLLQQLPMEAATQGFTDRALQQAWSQRDRSDQKERSGRLGMVAIAACLVLATSVALQSLWPLGDSTDSVSTAPQTAQVVPNRVSQIDLLMVSAVDLPDARITLRMDDNVSLAGYAGNRELGWPTSLTAGNNQLSLPVQLLGTDSGSISVFVEANGARKEMVFTVEALQPQRAAVLTI